MPRKDGTGPTGNGPKKVNQGRPLRDGSGQGGGRRRGGYKRNPEGSGGKSKWLNLRRLINSHRFGDPLSLLYINKLNINILY